MNALVGKRGELGDGDEPPLTLGLPLRWAAHPRLLDRRMRNRERGDIYYFVTPDGASLVRGYSHIVPAGLQIGSLRSQIAQRC